MDQVREIGYESPPKALGREPLDGKFTGAIGCQYRQCQPEPARAGSRPPEFAPAVPATSAPHHALRANAPTWFPAPRRGNRTIHPGAGIASSELPQAWTFPAANVSKSHR